MRNGKQRIAALLCCLMLGSILPAAGTGEALPNPETQADEIASEAEEMGGEAPDAGFYYGAKK